MQHPDESISAYTERLRYQYSSGNQIETLEACKHDGALAVAVATLLGERYGKTGSEEFQVALKQGQTGLIQTRSVFVGVWLSQGCWFEISRVLITEPGDRYISPGRRDRAFRMLIPPLLKTGLFNEAQRQQMQELFDRPY